MAPNGPRKPLRLPLVASIALVFVAGYAAVFAGILLAATLPRAPTLTIAVVAALIALIVLGR